MVDIVAIFADEAFARYALQAGIARAEHIEAARKLQALNADKGSLISLADALVGQDVITAVQREDILRKIQSQQAGGITHLGPYKLLKKLGEGGMGTVYLAEDVNIGRKVALKVLPKKLGDNQEFVSRFRREAQSAGKLNHVNIVSAFAAGEDRGYHYYAMEYCEGETLDKTLKQRRFPCDEAMSVVVQVARGLKHAHDNGVIHRDIKPANIILTAGGVVRILDLGLARTIGGTDQSFLTQTGIALGTPHYISPEQARGDKEIDGRADIYSLGATFYHMVTGQTPFDGATTAIVMTKHLNEELPNPRDINKNVPDGVVYIMQKMMAKQPADRYRDCAELLNDLALVIDGKMPNSQAVAEGKSSVAVRRTPAREPAAGPRRTAGPLSPVGTRQHGPLKRRGGIRRGDDAVQPQPVAGGSKRKPAYIALGVFGVGVLTVLFALLSRGKQDTETAANNPQPAERIKTETVAPAKTTTLLPATPTKAEDQPAPDTKTTPEPAPPPPPAPSTPDDTKRDIRAADARAAKAQQLFSAVLKEIAPLLAQSKSAEAVGILERRAQDPGFADAKELIQLEQADVAVVDMLRRQAVEAIRKMAGKTVTLKKGNGTITGKVKDDPKSKGITLDVGGPEIALPAEQIHVEDIDQYAPNIAHAVENLRRRGLLFLYAGDGAKAKEYFTKAQDAGLRAGAEPYLNRIAGLETGGTTAPSVSAADAPPRARHKDNDPIIIEIIRPPMEIGKTPSEQTILVDDIQIAPNSAGLPQDDLETMLSDDTSVSAPHKETPESRNNAAAHLFKTYSQHLATIIGFNDKHTHMVSGTGMFVSPNFILTTYSRAYEKLGDSALDKHYVIVSETNPHQLSGSLSLVADSKAADLALFYTNEPNERIKQLIPRLSRHTPIPGHTLLGLYRDFPKEGESGGLLNTGGTINPSEEIPVSRSRGISLSKNGITFACGPRHTVCIGYATYPPSNLMASAGPQIKGADNFLPACIKRDTTLTGSPIFDNTQFCGLITMGMREGNIDYITSPVTLRAFLRQYQQGTMKGSPQVAAKTKPAGVGGIDVAVGPKTAEPGVGVPAGKDVAGPGAQPGQEKAGDRAPLPAKAAVAEAQKTIRDAFKADYAKPTPSDRSALAGKLLAQGIAEQKDLPSKYALLCDARDIAVLGGDAAQAVEAVTEIALVFDVDSIAEKSAAITRAEAQVTSPDGREEAARQYAALADEAAACDNYDIAFKAVRSGSAAAQAAKNIPLNNRFRAKTQRLGAMQREYAAALPALKTINEKADDPALNLSVGRYLCFAKEKWDAGLPNLAKSSDSALKSIAQKDLGKPQQAEEQAALGEEWLALAQKQSSLAQVACLGRAWYWYKSSESGLTGFGKTKATAALGKIEAGLEQLDPEVAARKEDVPLPRLAYRGQGLSSGFTDGIDRTYYYLTITNRNAYPDWIFEPLKPSSETASKTRTTYSSTQRLYVTIHDANGASVDSWTLASRDSMDKQIYFMRTKGAKPPPMVYIILHDQKLNRKYKSNSVTIDPEKKLGN
ncbi:MAG: serine/threonine-protein kinase [Planctomycetota bacterium]|nr:serine/threonine-protein kinase [Planctomycetota bacterium]